MTSIAVKSKVSSGLVAEAVELHNEDGFREYMLRGGLTI